MRMPTDLDEEAKRAWNSVVKDLRRLNRLHETDAKIIELHARTYSLFRRVEAQLATEPLTLGNDRKFINPLASLYPTLAGRLEKTLREMGLTFRTRVEGDEEPEIDPNFADFEER